MSASSSRVTASQAALQIEAAKIMDCADPDDLHARGLATFVMVVDTTTTPVTISWASTIAEHKSTAHLLREIAAHLAQDVH